MGHGRQDWTIRISIQVIGGHLQVNFTGAINASLLVACLPGCQRLCRPGAVQFCPCRGITTQAWIQRKAQHDHPIPKDLPLER